jgi:hypothetical protein
MTKPAIPAEAVDAAAKILLGGGTVTDMLEVAAPYIRGGERNRLTLAIQRAIGELAKDDQP